ncbi:hypothetical protein Acr_24g0000460 [Actinidia rufa]|uniref:Pectinesterase inhibitor domain-containing protein n=1 Tax=Actinidia rufa TaxID=165716 RepID=A0A7J0GST1_9ERIC|nr:hypothetical protein Acr_24g0000460 [Actinidia rufa]
MRSQFQWKHKKNDQRRKKKPMAHFPTTLFLLVSFLLGLSCAGPAVMDAGVYGDICIRCKDRGFCLAALGSDRRSATADLTGLGYIAIDLMNKNLTATYNKLMTLNGQAINPALKKRVDTCLILYHDSIITCARDLGGYLKSARYDDLLRHTLVVGENGIDCENSFKINPPYPSPLTRENQNIDLLSDILYVISVILSTGGP